MIWAMGSELLNTVVEANPKHLVSALKILEEFVGKLTSCRLRSADIVLVARSH